MRDFAHQIHGAGQRNTGLQLQNKDPKTLQHESLIDIHGPCVSKRSLYRLEKRTTLLRFEKSTNIVFFKQLVKDVVFTSIYIA